MILQRNAAWDSHVISGDRKAQRKYEMKWNSELESSSKKRTVKLSSDAEDFFLFFALSEHSLTAPHAAQEFS
jgi:hypothetical protein